VGLVSVSIFAETLIGALVIALPARLNKFPRSDKEIPNFTVADRQLAG